MISEATVIAVAAALYLFDCVVLLERGQAVLETGWSPHSSRLGLAFGSKHYQIAGKTVALLNPLTPFFPVFRSLPLFSGPDPASVKLTAAFRSITPFAVLAFMQLILVFLTLPVCLYRAPGWPFLVALLLAYLNAIVMLALVWRQFGKAGIARRPLVALGFGWLACLPLSVNCLRSAGLSFQIAVDARRALRFLSENEWMRAREKLAAQVDEVLQELDEGDERHRRLAELRRQLTPEAGSERL